MRILITGGAGFQGSHLTERCIELGHQVTVLNTISEEAIANISPFTERFSVVWGSVTDQEVMHKTVRGQDVVIHLAARIHVDQSVQAPGSFLDVNVMGTYNILEALRVHGGRLIYSSSCEVYGAVGSQPATETSDLRPHSPYAASKAAADRLCYSYWKTYDTNVTIVRPCNIYGPRQKGGEGGAVIPRFVDSALAQQPLMVYGTGEQCREYMHVHDLVRAYQIILEATELQGQVINLGTGDTPSIKEIADRISQLSGTPVEYGPGRPGEVQGFRLSNQKAKELGFVPRIPFWEGLDEYFHWRRSLKGS